MTGKERVGIASQLSVVRPDLVEVLDDRFTTLVYYRFCLEAGIRLCIDKKDGRVLEYRHQKYFFASWSGKRKTPAQLDYLVDQRLEAMKDAFLVDNPMTQE